MKPRACIVVASEMTVRVFLARQLAAMQEHYALTLVVNSDRGGLLQEIGVEGRLCRLPIERGVAPWHDVKAAWLLWRLLRAGRFELVHSMTPKAGLLAMAAAWLARTPVRIHTFTGQVWATRAGCARLGLRVLDMIVARAATFTLADSPSQREFLIAQGVVPAAKVAVVGNGSVSGVDPLRFRPDAARRRSVRERLDFGAADIVVLFVGRLTKDKGVLDLAQAFVRLADRQPDVRLVFVGPDEQQMQPRIRALCRHYLERVHFIGFTTRPEDLMAAADVLCLPSYREGFGTVIVEAAAAGVPAVASRIYGVVDAIEADRTGLLYEPGDVEGLVDALSRVTRDTGLRRSLGAVAHARALRKFAAADVTAAVLGRYEQLLARSGRSGWYRRVGKRVLDVVAASIGIALLWPLALGIALAVRVALGAPVLFRQQRPGLHGRPFALVKFRSMTGRYDAGGASLPDAARLTAFGRFLRAWSLDELPELWHVLTGEMSLVGPRPLLMEYLPRYTPRQARRHEVRPGITGLAQVSGRNGLGWHERFELDVRYVDELSLALDLAILARTIWQVVARRGISQPGRATVDLFQGSVETRR